jgi:hypothetical protein
MSLLIAVVLRFQSMTRTRTVMTVLSVAAIATPLAANSPAPPPAPLAAEVIERFIACYPRIDAVRVRFREEAARLEQHHKADLDRLSRDLETKRGPGGPPDLDGFHTHAQHKDDLVNRPAADLVFLPVLRACGFKSVADYAESMRAVIYHFSSQPDWLRPYLERVDGLRVPNLD